MDGALGQQLTVVRKDHPPGERGVRSSLNEVANKIAEGGSHPKVRAWALEQLERARKLEGIGCKTDRERADVLLRAVQKKLWVPDPVATEFMAGAHLTACDRSTPDELCFISGDCDDLAILLGSCFLSVGLNAMVVGHGYDRDQNIQHVLLAVRVRKQGGAAAISGGRQQHEWLYADPSLPTMKLGQVTAFSRERLLSVPDVKVICDASSCLVNRDFDPDELGFAEHGVFVGVDGVPERMRRSFTWLAASPASAARSFQWLGVTAAEVAKAYGYTGQSASSDQLVQEIIARNGDTSRESLKAYGGIAGTLVASGACVATGVGTAVVALCAYLGGVLGTLIGSAIPIASGSTLEDVVVDTWNNYQKPLAQAAHWRQLAAKSYLVLRDAAIDEAAFYYVLAGTGATADDGRAFAAKWLNDRLWGLGYTLGIPIQWQPGATPAHPSGDPDRAQRDYDNYQHAVAVSEGREPPRDQEESIAKSKGLLPAYEFPTGPVLSPDSPFSWNAIGYDEAAENRSAMYVQALAQNKQALMEAAKLGHPQCPENTFWNTTLNACTVSLKAAPRRPKPTTTTSSTLPVVLGVGAAGALAAWLLLR